jgi:hypothetical protein
VSNAVWHFRAFAASASAVTDLYLLRADNRTLVRVDFADGTFWLVKSFQAGSQAATSLALEWEGDSDDVDGDLGDDVDQADVLCTCKKKLDVLVLMQRDAEVTAGEYAFVKALVGVNMMQYTANCGAAFGYQFGSVDPETGTCVAGVN